MAVGDVSKLVIKLRMSGQEMRPGLHFQSNVTLNDAASLINSWRSTCESSMRAVMSNEVEVTGYNVEDKVPGSAATFESPVDPPLPGTSVTTAIPAQNAAVTSLKTALKSQRARGRIYWPGLTEDGTAGGVLTAPYIAAWNTFIAAIEANYLGSSPVSGWRLVVYSPEQLTAPPPPPAFKPRPGTIVTPVTNVVLDPVVRSQRRRQLGRGQ